MDSQREAGRDTAKASGKVDRRVQRCQKGLAPQPATGKIEAAFFVSLITIDVSYIVLLQFSFMKEINISIDDELYRQARQRLEDLESSVTDCVTSYLQGLNGDDRQIAAARSRMEELFRSTKGFGVGHKLAREETHERGFDWTVIPQP